MHCFNSQEKQLKAGRGLTNTQRSKIDEQHPAWTNHSTEGEASQQTRRVQEAMTGLMVWKILLMNGEKRLWLSLTYLAAGHHYDSNVTLKVCFGQCGSTVGLTYRQITYFYFIQTSSPLIRWCSSKLVVVFLYIKLKLSLRQSSSMPFSLISSV